jgi:hypothetical protein
VLKHMHRVSYDRTKAVETIRELHEVSQTKFKLGNHSQSDGFFLHRGVAILNVSYESSTVCSDLGLK